MIPKTTIAACVLAALTIAGLGLWAAYALPALLGGVQ